MSDHDVVRTADEQLPRESPGNHRHGSQPVGAGSSASSVTSRGPAPGRLGRRRRRSRCSATSTSTSGTPRSRSADSSSTRSPRSGTSRCWCPTAPWSTSAGSRCSAARRSPSTGPTRPSRRRRSGYVDSPSSGVSRFAARDRRQVASASGRSPRRRHGRAGPGRAARGAVGPDAGAVRRRRRPGGPLRCRILCTPPGSAGSPRPWC